MAATVDGRPVRLTVMDELRLGPGQPGRAAGSGCIAADIPGLVVEVKVTAGQKVHKGEPVIVVEAMKMQNELCAGVSGTVAEVPVALGQTVNPGDVLVVIEPEPGARTPGPARTVTVSPPIPQLSVSTSSITTTVVAGFFPSPIRRRPVTLAMSRSFCSGVAPSRVILMFT